MAYAEKYNLTYTDYKSDTWRYGIFKLSYGGASSIIKSTGNPLQGIHHGGGLFVPVRSSEYILKVISESDQQFSEFFTAGVLDYYMVVKKNGAVYWSGTYVTETFTEPYTDFPYTISLRFNDLGPLKYIDGNPNRQGLLNVGRMRFLSMINAVTGDLPYELNLVDMINVFPDERTEVATDSTLKVTQSSIYQFEKVNEATGAIEYISGYAMLERIMVSFGATMYQSNGKWYVVRIEELLADPVAYVEYDAGLETIAGSGNLTLRTNITNNEAGITWLNQDGEVESDDTYNEIVYKHPEQGEILTQTGSEIIKDWSMDYFNDSSTAADRVQMWQLTNVTAGTDIDKGAFNTVEGFLVLENAMIVTTADETISIKARREPTETITDSRVFSTGSKGLIRLNVQPTITMSSYTSASLNLTYELVVPIRIQIGTYYLTEANDGTLSWTTNASTVNVRFDSIVSNMQPTSYLSSGGGTTQAGYFNFADRLIETPVFPESGAKDCTITMYPNIETQLDNGNIVTDRVYIDKFSFQYLWNGNQVTDAYNTTLNDIASIKERKLDVEIYFGGDYITTGLDGIIFSAGISETIASTTWHTRGNSEAETHAVIFILDPYSNFYGGYRRIITGTLYGNTDFDFHNTLVLKEDSAVMMIDEMSYNIKTGSQNVRMIEIASAAPSSTTISLVGTIAIQEVFHTETNTPDPHDPVKAVQDVIGPSGITSLVGVNIAPKSGQVKSIDGTKGNSTNYQSYP